MADDASTARAPLRRPAPDHCRREGAAAAAARGGGGRKYPVFPAGRPVAATYIGTCQ
ncbi:histone-lysine N-methyltransferase, H3 lysine-79 specific [Rhodovulum sulfidophilum]|uniref:Histone-lysine N-methyltransferase, H3 lysine-79 specific n=1 Tax=Rhodovulum sulfidophilum TaxID=35806 RepID=A0A0D6B2N1_RHOSU|nr:histone-lysine N-methyltransferase, H3 lysine-79 specific [Rhodovulum sulfidophilum]